MAKWKYTKEQPTINKKDLFLRLEKGKAKRLRITDWEFLKGHHSGALFKCNVVEEDGVPADKFWYVWDFDLMEQLKKGIRGKKLKSEALFTITKDADDEDIEEEYVIKWGE